MADELAARKASAMVRAMINGNIPEVYGAIRIGKWKLITGLPGRGDWYGTDPTQAWQGDYIVCRHLISLNPAFAFLSLVRVIIPCCSASLFSLPFLQGIINCDRERVRSTLLHFLDLSKRYETI